jgi:hypothetical protein
MTDIAAIRFARLDTAGQPRGGCIYTEKINGPVPIRTEGTPAEYKAGLERAIANGWLVPHESGTYVKFTEARAARVA